MIVFFKNKDHYIYAAVTQTQLSKQALDKLHGLFQGYAYTTESFTHSYIGPHPTMVSPWSTNVVEIIENIGIESISRVESLRPQDETFDPLLEFHYETIGQHIFDQTQRPHDIQWIEATHIDTYQKSQNLNLDPSEVGHLKACALKWKRPLTDSEIFGFAQINSEHCRHKIFNGQFNIDGQAQNDSLFARIKHTSKLHPNRIVSAYTDNVAFVQGPQATQFAPKDATLPSRYTKKTFASVLALKAETHNFPTTVEPFFGAGTGSGGEIRDRMAGGQGSIPMAGTAVYMTAHTRLHQDQHYTSAPRKWLYQSPVDILIKASNGASDYGNKFGQPLISGSVFTFEHQSKDANYGYDKVVMQAGGVGMAHHKHAFKQDLTKGDLIILLGGDNYRIGMGGASVSSEDTGTFDMSVERSAIQRANPEMQKRVANVIRACTEMPINPIKSIHDHGAGGHLNCFVELVEKTGGRINIDQLPLGDQSLSIKEILGNESQERMGLVISPNDLEQLKAVASRERAPLYVVGEVTMDGRCVFTSKKTQDKGHAFDLPIQDLMGNIPKTYIQDHTTTPAFEPLNLDSKHMHAYLKDVLRLESVACKDWLTHKVDRCVGGRVAKQQTVGPLQLPLNNFGAMTVDFESKHAIATSIGHHPVSGLIDAQAGSRNSIAEALTNLVWAPLTFGLKGISLSANWMWPCKTPGEDSRLYDAVHAASQFACELGINIPTGKDSLSMKQQYPDQTWIAPGTVIISTIAQCENVHQMVEPVFQKDAGPIYYINMSQELFQLGGSALAISQSKVGQHPPDIKDPQYFTQAFEWLQMLIKNNHIVAGHDVGQGGLITTLLELCFADLDLGAQIDLKCFDDQDILNVLFAENAGVVFQTQGPIDEIIQTSGIACFNIGKVLEKPNMMLSHQGYMHTFDIQTLRQEWFETSYLMDKHQNTTEHAHLRKQNVASQPLKFTFPPAFNGVPSIITDKTRPIKAAIIREQGSNSERELAHALYLSGFEVIDVHMTDVIEGRCDFSDVQFLGAVGGFSNSDVLGSAKGWAAAFRYNPKAFIALQDFFKRPDTLSIGICNGCQLFTALDLLNPHTPGQIQLTHNDSGMFECVFTSVTIQDNTSPMFQGLTGSTLGIWSAHGEGKFYFGKDFNGMQLVGTFGYEQYPANPNGSPKGAAIIASLDGRHVSSMPHMERSIFPHNWAHYPKNRKSDKVSPWLSIFENAYQWCAAYSGS